MKEKKGLGSFWPRIFLNYLSHGFRKVLTDPTKLTLFVCVNIWNQLIYVTFSTEISNKLELHFFFWFSAISGTLQHWSFFRSHISKVYLLKILQARVTLSFWRRSELSIEMEYTHPFSVAVCIYIHPHLFFVVIEPSNWCLAFPPFLNTL